MTRDKEVEIAFDVVCPYAYLASTQIEAIAARQGARVVWEPILLGGVFRAIGQVDDPNRAMSEAKRRHTELDLRRWSEHFGVPLVRRPAKFCLRMLASYLAGTRIPDLNSGLRAMRRELVQRYRPIIPNGFSFTTTITLASLTNDHRVDWVSIDYKKRSGSSKIRPIRDTLG